jgi:GGDEF domain-containing protein
MAIVSIKRYLNMNGLEEAPQQALPLVIEKLGECAVECDPEELRTFQSQMSEISDALIPDLPPKNMLVLAESAMQALEDYNKRIMKLIGRQGSDFQTIANMLQTSLVKIAGHNTESVQGLSRIGKELERAIGFKDLQSLKIHLGTCLEDLREEIDREKTASKALIERLQIEIEGFRGPGVRLPQQKADAATGLPGYEECIAAIQEAIGRGTRHYAVVMVVNRVQPISARFGKEAGDWMLAQFSEYIGTQLTPADQLFRWTGPALVGILERPQALDQVRGIVRRMFDTPINKTYDVNGRSVFIPISAASSIQILATTPEGTEKQIQKFIASQGCRDFA